MLLVVGAVEDIDLHPRYDDPMGSVSYDPATALIVVDVQNDFADPKGNLYVKSGEDVVPIINAEISLAKSAGRPCGLHGRLASGIDPSLPEGRRNLAGSLRR